ncbi:MAG: hypothetical protein ACHQQQ_00050 [Bacteroidota bacterium]
MSERNPSINYYAGSGTPRLIAIKSLIYESASDTTFTESTIQEDEGSPVNIASSEIGNPAVILTESPNDFQQGDWVRISGHSGSIPDINGIYQVLEKPDPSTIKIGVNLTTGGTGGAVRWTSAFLERGLTPNQRIVVDTGDFVSYAKILSVDTTVESAPVIIIDRWSNGVPQNGSIFSVDGYIADLPRCGEMTEAHTPYGLVHNLYRGRKSSKQFGWTYRCAFDYSKYFSADAVLALIEQLNIGPDDSLILIPRNDAPEYQYNVFYKDDIQVSLFGRSPGYRKVILSFEGMELQSFPKPLTGYGAAYGWNYGVGL